MAGGDASEGGDGAGSVTPAVDSELLVKTLILEGVGEDSLATETLGRRGSAQGLTAGVVKALPRLDVSDDGVARTELQVVEELGRGGMGVVELARQQSLGREVAIKRLHPHHGEFELHALLNEARTTGHLEHPNIVPIHAIGADERHGPVVIMKRIHGTPWKTLIHDDGATAMARHLEILSHVCNALHFAHSRGVVHCDMKPANVMVGDFGEVYVVDWGVAMLLDGSAEDCVRGSPAYMAPELVHGVAKAIGPWTDVFLLGACLHEVLVGKPRYPIRDVVRAMEAAASPSPHAYADDVPATLAAIANKACAAEPEDRYGSALELRVALQDYLDERSALELTRVAMGRLEEFREAVSADAPDADTRARAAEFAFEHVLEVRPALTEAARGLQSLWVAMLERELGRGNLAAAESLLSRLEDVPSGLRQEYEAQRAAEAKKRELLATHAHDRDARVARAQRRRVALLLLAFVIVVVAVLHFKYEDRTKADISPAGLLVVGVAIWAFGVGCLIAWRKALLANAYNRRWMTFMVGILTGLVAHRGVAMIAGIPAAQTIIIDMVIFGTAFIAAAWLSRVFYVVALAMFTMAAIAATEPELGRLFVNAAGIGGVSTMLWLWSSTADDD